MSDGHAVSSSNQFFSLALSIKLVSMKVGVEW